jgi:hypothetical protein
MLMSLRARLPPEEPAAREETTMVMVHEPRHKRGPCTLQGNALCFGVALGGLVLAAMVLSWLISMVSLLF